MTLNEFLGKAGDLFKPAAAQGEMVPKADYDKVVAENQKLQADGAAARAEVDQHKADAIKAKTDAEAVIEAKEQEVEKRANIKAQEQIAKAGHKPLPEQGQGGTETGGKATLDSIRAQIAKEQDPVKRGELARQARELRGHSDLFGKN